MVSLHYFTLLKRVLYMLHFIQHKSYLMDSLTINVSFSPIYFAKKFITTQSQNISKYIYILGTFIILNISTIFSNQEITIRLKFHHMICVKYNFTQKPIIPKITLRLYLNTIKITENNYIVFLTSNQSFSFTVNNFDLPI